MTTALRLAAPGLAGRHDLTVDDLTGLPEDLRYELIDGRLVLTPHAVPTHGILATEVGYALKQHCPRELALNIEQRLLINDRNELCPDVMFVHAANKDRSPVFPVHVPIVVEIISRSSRFYDREQKLKTYASLGIPAYWIIDPLVGDVTFSQYALGSDGAYQLRLHTDRLITVPEPWEATLDLPAWTRRCDQWRSYE